MAQVKIIAPQTREAEHLRVAAYCRVSSDSKDQLHSYAAQIRSYTEEIAQHDGWELVDVYADEGLTGTRMDQRDDFNRMMRDCRKGKINRILVKSVSRFARNTRDCLSALRELSAMGVSVRFEKENIDTKTLTTELMVSVSGSLAQQESISISANQKMSYQRRMERGEFITCTAPYGYRIVNKKDLEIVPEEAATVRWIFDAYLKGRSSGWIAEQLTAKGIPSQSGAECWRETGIRYLLTNEKYIGDALSQKSYSCGFPFVQKRNHGERLQYYTENSHPAIIDRDTFERVQALLQKKAQKEKSAEKKPSCLKNRLRELRDGVSAPKQPERICDLGLPNPRPPRRGLPCRTHPGSGDPCRLPADVPQAQKQRGHHSGPGPPAAEHAGHDPAAESSAGAGHQPGHRGSNRRKP